jgi:3-oxoacyl-[acyl-carrier protein] reductase
MSSPPGIDLRGRRALVTGGGRGIGAAISTWLARCGARVAINCRSNEARAKSVAADIEALGGEAIVVRADVGDPEEAAAMVAQVADAFGGLDLLVNNAAVVRRGSFADHSVADRDEVIRVNLGGTFNVTQAALPHLRASDRAAIVNVSSIVGQIGDLATAPSYGASKGGVDALTKSLARELAPEGIRVNAVSPHAIATEMSAEWSDERRVRIVAGIPLGRLGTPDEVAAVVVFLLSDLAAFITGEIVDVNGGAWSG